jgi:hypothetical protein
VAEPALAPAFGLEEAWQGGWVMGRLRFLGAGMAVLAMLGVGPTAEAAKWSRTYIRQLPDSAFAAIERTPEGRAIRHLPHHDAAGDLDLPHLCNALSRLGQVKWRDPANAEIARRHLQEHLEQVGRSSCRPPRKNTP